MKYITFVIPSYNSQEYLHFALDSLVCGGDDIEVLIISDGSKDETFKIAKEYENKYPNVFKAINQSNTGHGGVINHGLKLARGKYFKVLDSDDWVDEIALKLVLDYIKKDTDVDLILNDYVYRQGYDGEQNRINYKNAFTPNKEITFNDVKKIHIQQYITLHSAIYKTETLKRANVVLPEHCYYEDNLFVYYPLPYVEKLIYLPIPLYQYLIGRGGQSMEKENMISRYKDFVKLADIIFSLYDIMPYKKTNKGLYKIMRHALILNCLLVPMNCRLSKEKDAQIAYNKFNHKMKLNNKKQYKMIRRAFPYWSFTRKTYLGILLIRYGLWLSHKLVKYN